MWMTELVTVVVGGVLVNIALHWFDARVGAYSRTCQAPVPPVQETLTTLELAAMPIISRRDAEFVGLRSATYDLSLIHI